MGTDNSGELDNLPQPTAVDRAYDLTKVAIPTAAAMVPGYGPVLAPFAAIATEMASGWIGKPIERRRERFFADWVERTEAFEASYAEFNAETAFENEAFVTAFLEALPIAIRTHQEEKREALLNGLSHAAFPD